MSEYTVVGMFYTAMQTALLACIRYWLYQDNLRVKAKQMYALVFAVSLGGTGLWLALSGFGGLSFSSFRIMTAVFMYALSCVIIREPWAKHAYTYSFIMVYDSTLELTATHVQNLLAPGARGWVFALAAALLLALTFIPAVRCLKRMIQRLTMLENDRIWTWLCVISFSFVFMNLIFTYPADALTLRILLSRYLMLLGVIGLYVATTRAMQIMSRSAEAQAELELVRQRVSLQQNQYDRLVAQMDEVRRMRHDLRHHRAVLTALAKESDLSALTDYLDTVAGPENAPPITGNLAADSMLLYYLDAARALDVTVETELCLGRETVLPDSELAVVLGNLLENAVEAQSYVEPDRRFIRIRAKSDPGGLTLAVDNRFDGTLIKTGESYRSRKGGEGHGLGLASVQAVCEKHGGVLQIEIADDLFMAGVAIGL